MAFFACPPGSGLAVLDTVTGRQRTWTIPEDIELGDWPLRWSPDSSQLLYLLRRLGQAPPTFHALPLEGTTSVTQGRRDLPLVHHPDCEFVPPPSFRDRDRLVVVEQCPNDAYLIDYDLSTNRQVARTALALRASVFDVVVDPSGAHLRFLAGQRQVKQTPSIYILRHGRAQQLPNPCDCWKVAW